MLSQDYILAKFGIDEIYFHQGLPSDLLQKLYQRAILSLDGEDPVVQQYAAFEMILICHKQTPTPGLVYRLLKTLKGNAEFIRLNTLLNEEELFSAIKSKNYVLVTNKILIK